MAISEAEQSSLTEKLVRDVGATIGRGHDGMIRDYVADLASHFDDPDGYRDKVVEEVQQYFHDCFVDTTWPRCPLHLNHPLWLHGNSWCCERDDRPVATLGELRTMAAS